VGWVFNIALSLLVANAIGFMTKEWKGAPSASTRTLFAGLAVLVLAMGILAHGNNLVTGK
jgi:phosphate/sulfate permease